MEKNADLSLAYIANQREGIQLAARFAQASGACRVDLSTWNPTYVRATIQYSAEHNGNAPVVIAIRSEDGALGCLELWGIRVEHATGLDEVDLALAENYLRKAAASERRAELNSFFNGLLHDLRSPLRHVCAIAGLLGEAEIDRPQLEAAMNKEVRDVEKLLKMGQHFADSYGSPENSTCSVQAAWQRTVYEHECECVECKALLQASIPPELRVRMAEPDLCRVLKELIDNSHKFASDSPFIFLRAEAGVAGGVSIRYWDQSGGVDDQYAAKVFKPFFRGHRGSYEGQGLGLFLCREMIRRAGGKIELGHAGENDSKAQPRGLIFDIWLPRV